MFGHDIDRDFAALNFIRACLNARGGLCIGVFVAHAC